ncbi:hypothetical protein AUR04nite_31260 [Glutamicibacter uratoxydans]|uniref:VOC domain-containing protein n=1 Tax=Glutamicibacter uratoxydans TaxID=43667 RepID=A0A4Y4DUP4_GLUUR|nr:VOC family protein [Glutamicibacter uratoxydans]GED07594.1 hypothetical protein AUR04nite_31260 [Glutamicibacter uratoxydans]
MEAITELRSPQTILFSADVDRSANFYRLLGFTEVFRVPTEGTPIHIDMELDGYRIGFALIDSARTDHGLNPVDEGQRATITLWTEDTRAAVASLKERGFKVLHGPHEYLGRLLIAWIIDPDEHPIQIVQNLRSRQRPDRMATESAEWAVLAAPREERT